MEKVITKDGSITFHNKEFDEHYHSLTGAKEEAREKYARPTLEFFGENLPKKIRILDFCFGLGYNSLVFLEELAKAGFNGEVEVVGIDNDIEIVTEGKKILKDQIDNHVYGNEKVNLKVEIGDAADIINELEGTFDICFFDPFSPKKCPKLWTFEVFDKVFKLMSKKSILTTYSCARVVRDNMRQAGFDVKDGPIIGRWAPATLGLKNTN